MTVLDILITALVGMLVVFTVLVILMCAINIMAAIFKKMDKKSKPESAQAPEAKPAAAVASAPAPGSCGGVVLKNVSDRDAAMVMAIVADKLNTPLNELRFISITSTEEN